jgi:hypothetical protein
MAARRQTGKLRALPFESIYGVELPARAAVLGGQRKAERELLREFRETTARRAELTAASNRVHASLLDSLKRDKRTADGVQRLRELQDRLSKQRLRIPAASKASRRIFTGSIGATVVPPYNYPWIWSATSGVVSHTESADINSGTMAFYLYAGGEGAASGTDFASVGIFFYPQPDCPTELQVWTTPSFNFAWWTICAFASAHSDGWIGLRVDTYNLAGALVGTPVYQKNSLWWDDSWWSGASNSGSNSGYPLYARLTVDRDHYYAIRVWCGGSVSAAGWSTFSGSAAKASLSASVPSITWQLG